MDVDAVPWSVAQGSSSLPTSECIPIATCVLCLSLSLSLSPPPVHPSASWQPHWFHCCPARPRLAGRTAFKSAPRRTTPIICCQPLPCLPTPGPRPPSQLANRQSIIAFVTRVTETPSSPPTGPDNDTSPRMKKSAPSEPPPWTPVCTLKNLLPPLPKPVPLSFKPVPLSFKPVPLSFKPVPLSFKPVPLPSPNQLPFPNQSHCQTSSSPLPKPVPVPFPNQFQSPSQTSSRPFPKSELKTHPSRPWEPPPPPLKIKDEFSP